MKKGYLIIATALICSLVFGSATLPQESEAVSTPKLKTKNLSIEKGKTKTIKITGKRIKSKTFKSGKKSIATVSKKGKVTAKKKGTCKISIAVKYYKTKKAKKLSKKNLICTVTVTATDPKKRNRPPLTITDPFVKQMANTSVDIVKKNAEAPLQKNENVLISPESILTAMAMAVNGAGGETLQEMQKALYGELSVDEFNKNMSNYNDHLVLSDKVKFHLANSIWVRNNFPVKQNFLDTNKKFYNSQVYTEPFDNSTVPKINKWVSDNTDKMIPSIIDNIPSDIRMYLINALCFDGRWQSQYSKNQINKETFTSATEEKKTVSMLCETEYYTYLKDDKAVGFIKPYEGNEYSFAAILPNKDVSVSDYLKSMTGESFVGLIKSGKIERVETKIPEFSYDYETDLVETMKLMGIQKAFSIGNSDFSNITEAEPLMIDSILHKTHIELDKNGTKAAAVTVIASKATAISMEPPKQVFLNRPFLYAIIDNKTGLPVFLGVLNSVK